MQLRLEIVFRATLLTALFYVGSALAQEAPKSTPPVAKWGQTVQPDTSFSVGAGALIGHNHRKDSETWPYNARTYVRFIPVAEFKYKRLQIFGPFASLRALEGENWSVSLRGGIQGDQYRGPGMEERDWSVFGGLTLKYRFLEFTYARDLQSVSDGSTYAIETGPKFPLSRSIFLVTSIGATYLDKNYANYYYGVLPQEGTATRPAYDIDGAYVYSLSLRPLFMLTDKWTLMTMVKFSLYSKEITESPTVRDEPGISGLVALTYKLI